MFKKLAKIEYLPNNFKILEKGITFYVLFRAKNSFRQFELLECRYSRSLLFI